MLNSCNSKGITPVLSLHGQQKQIRCDSLLLSLLCCVMDACSGLSRRWVLQHHWQDRNTCMIHHHWSRKHLQRAGSRNQLKCTHLAAFDLQISMVDVTGGQTVSSTGTLLLESRVYVLVTGLILTCKSPSTHLVGREK